MEVIHDMERASIRRALWLPASLGLLAALLIFAGLGANSLHNRDEARHALVAENILHDGDWLTLHHEDAPYFNKAPLKFWLTALTFRLGGVNAWTARLWSALFAWGAVVVTGLLGARLYDRRTGLLAAFILVTSTQFLYSHCARTGELDSALLFFWTLACLLVVAGTRHRPLFYLGCAAVGLCGMVKHLGFVPELLLILGLWLGLGGYWRALGAATLLRGLGIVLLVALPWHAWQYVRHGAAFVDAYFGREMIYRGLEYGNTRHDLRFFLVVLKDGLFPWSLLLPLAIWRLTRTRAPLALRPGLLPALWSVVVLVLISVSRVKLPWYVLPAYPALALLLARFVATEWAMRPTRTLDTLVGVGWLVIALSPLNVGRFNPFAVPAQEGMVKADLLGLLQGGGVGPWPAPTLTGLAALGALAATAAALLSARGQVMNPRATLARRLAIAVLGVLALGTAAAPLRFATTRAPLDLLVARAGSFVSPADTVAVVLDAELLSDDRTEFSLRRLPGRRVAALSPGARWLLTSWAEPAPRHSADWREILRLGDLALLQRR
jgi:4-amino-4-deoxy-L-arabinose transferase-like glycosyltransferase